MVVRVLLFFQLLLSVVFMFPFVYIVPLTLVVLTFLLVKKMRGKWSLIPHVSHLFLSNVLSFIISGPAPWTGLLFLLAAVVCRPCHVNIKREIQLTPRGVTMLHHVDARKRLRINLHGKLSQDQSALLDSRLDLPTEFFAVIGDVGERVVPLAVWPPAQFLHRREFMALG